MAKNRITQTQFWDYDGNPSFETFDEFESLAAGEREKRLGIDRAAESKSELLAIARKVAFDLASRVVEITADDVQAELVFMGYGAHDLGNAAGALFRGDEWEWTGKRRKSRRVHAHANELKVWKLKSLPGS